MNLKEMFPNGLATKKPESDTDVLESVDNLFNPFFAATSTSTISLTLATQESFDNIPCDFYTAEQQDEIYVTRQQVGQALGYDNPNKAIDNIHQRHQARLDQFSTTLTLGVVEGGRNVSRKMTVYTAKGVYEICRWSRQPKADAFMDFVWEVVEGIRTKKLKVIPSNEPTAQDVAAIAAQAAVQALVAVLPDIVKAVQGTVPQAATAPPRIADARLAVLPDTLTVKQVRIYLGVSFDRAYSLFHSADFPAYTIGRALFVGKTEFIQWLSTTSKQGIFLG